MGSHNNPMHPTVHLSNCGRTEMHGGHNKAMRGNSIAMLPNIAPVGNGFAISSQENKRQCDASSWKRFDQAVLTHAEVTERLMPSPVAQHVFDCTASTFGTAAQS
eukprot:6392387-Amphidinium_carterae.2